MLRVCYLAASQRGSASEQALHIWTLGRVVRAAMPYERLDPGFFSSPWRSDTFFHPRAEAVFYE